MLPDRPSVKSLSKLVTLVQEDHYPPLPRPVLQFPFTFSQPGRVCFGFYGRAEEVLGALQIWRIFVQHVTWSFGTRYKWPVTSMLTIGRISTDITKSTWPSPSHGSSGARRKRNRKVNKSACRAVTGMNRKWLPPCFFNSVVLSMQEQAIACNLLLQR